jgi:hypothetical protein
MKKACADIRWNSYEEGGRKILLQPGYMYYPHISIDPQIDSEPWSVCFLVTPIGPDRTSTISFSMLADNEEANSFFAKFHVGRNKIVAVGQIRCIE